MKKSNLLFIDYAIFLSLIIISSVGVMYSNVNFQMLANNVYGDTVELFGRGIYAYESAFKGPIFVGTDIAVLLLIVVAILSQYFIKNVGIRKLVYISFLTVFLYYVASLAFGTMMNRLFILYLFAFGMILFRLIDQLVSYDYSKLTHVMNEIKYPKGLRVFLIIMGLSVSVWLSEIALLILNNRPSELIGMQSTEPTYIFDLAIIAPACFLAAHKIKNRKAFGLILSVMMLSLLCAIGIIVISQTLTQSFFGVIVGINELIAFVFSFFLLSTFAFYYLIRTLKLISTNIN